jgi:heme/copper-type cytochrome/quinol oxidase subunit 4
VKSTKYYLIRFAFAMIAYVATLSLALVFLQSFPDTFLRVPAALLPLIPVFFGLYFFIQAMSQLDEMQRRIQFEAVAFSFCGTAIITFGYGLLESAGFYSPGYLYILPLMVILWGFGQAFAMRRYR